jgi:hypothetical protein
MLAAGRRRLRLCLLMLTLRRYAPAPAYGPGEYGAEPRWKPAAVQPMTPRVMAMQRMIAAVILMLVEV